jgi:ankyrin repeat protein
LLYQLLHLDGTSTAAVHGALEDEDQSSRWKSEHSSSDPWTFSRLRDVFKSVIGRFPNSFRTLYIIDALDECDETLSVFLKSVVDILQAKPSSRIKFLFLSRRILSSSIDSQFKSVGGTFQIIMNETTAHIENVQRYIQTKVDDLCMLRPGISHLRPEIVQELEQRSVGIYLLASLNLKSLVTAEATTLNIRLVIRTLPGDLQAIYSQALNKVAPGYQLKAAALLLWVVFAVRPLRVCELSAAVAMTCLEKPITSDSDLKDKVSLDILGDMSVLFGPLIRVTGDVVSLVHSSARQYLLSLAPTPSRYNDAGGHYWVWGWIRVSKGWEVDSIAAMASQVLSLNCRELISYASGANISASLPDPTSEDNPDTAIRSLLHYAIESLPDHVRQSPPGPDKDAVFASFLKSDTGRAWMRQFWMLKDPTQAYKRFSPLEFCCALGLVEIAKQFLPLDRYPRIKLPDVQSVKRARVDATELLTAADLAAMFGNVEILRVLCEGKGTPADSDDLIPQTSWKATVSGWVHIGRNYGHDEIPNPAPGTRGEDVANERERAVEQLSWYRPLHTATAYGHAEAAEYLISRGASISRQDESGKWAIEIAMEKSIEGLVQLLLYHHQDDILQLLRRFVEVGNPNSIELLLQLHPRLLSNGVHFKTILGEHNGSILHLAAAAGSLTVYKLLVRLGAKHDLKDSEGRQAIHYAAASGQTAFIQSILADGIASRTDQDALGRNPLFYATLGASCCEDGRWTPVPEREQVIPILVGNIRTIDSKSLVSSALNSLARFSCYESSILPGEDSPARNFERCLRTLHSMAPDITLDGGLLHAAFKSTFFPLEVALDLAPDVNKTDSSGRTALHVAAAAEREWGHWHRELAKMVADIDQRDVGGMTALLLAIHSAEKPDICSHYVLPRIRVLLDRGADATCADVRGVTPISAAAEFLLTAPDPRKHWSEPRAVDDGLLTSLLSRLSTFAENISDEVLPRLIAALATSGRQKDLMSLMKAMSARQRSQWLEQGLDTVPMTEKLLFTCHELGWPPKALSAMASHLDNEQLELVYIRAFQEKSRAITEICRPHLEGHDDASWLDRRGSRLHLINAAQRGDKDTIELFLEVMKGDVDAKDKAGQTMLSHAAEAGHVELTKYLIFRGAESSVPDAKGRTAVYWAAREGKLDALKLLVEADAPVTEEDIGIATSMGREAVRAYLEVTMEIKSGLNEIPKRKAALYAVLGTAPTCRVIAPAGIQLSCSIIKSPKEKRQVSREHPETLMSMNNLASALHQQGRYAEAEAMDQQTLQLKEAMHRRDIS